MGRYINQLYYITHIDNIPSILQQGILSHQSIEERKIPFAPIYAKDIVSRRAQKIIPGGKTLWAFANLYFQGRNPMLFRVVHEKRLEEIAVIAVRKDVLDISGTFITDGNAASTPTVFIPWSNAREDWGEIVKNTQREWWNEEDGSKRKIMAECLVPEGVPPDFVQTIYVPNNEVQKKVKQSISGFDVPVVPEPGMFFQPTLKKKLKDNLFLAKGDMFFSKLQTLTISVNCVGVMGKGLASRAKYQFPRVYVYYQDLCRQKKLRLGLPSLYKMEVSRDYDLADEPMSMVNGLTQTWFLLFPTKEDWRNRADISGIEKGLQWLCSNYRKEGIKSLAMPALGCGLGWLEWSVVGPILCTCLAGLDIETWVYLPTEREIPQDQLSAEFLLTSKTR